MAGDRSKWTGQYAQAGAGAASSEEFGVLAVKAMLRGAMAHQITSADGKSLVVPFSISVTPTPHTGPENLESITADCTVICLKVLGHSVICVRSCITKQVTLEHHDHLLDDQALKALVTPGPPLKDPALVQAALGKSILRAGTPMEAGIILVNAVLTGLSERPDLIGEDGSAAVTGLANITIPKLGSGPAPDDLTTTCSEYCITVFNQEITCIEVCHDVLQ